MSTPKAYFCPEGHGPLEDRLAESTNRGLYCPECRDHYRCPRCGFEGRYSEKPVEYLSNAEKAKITGQKPNWRDAGVYGLCPGCQKGFVVSPGGWWYNEKSLVAVGGKAVRVEPSFWTAENRAKARPQRANSRPSRPPRRYPWQ